MKSDSSSTSVHDVVLLPCPFCGGEAELVSDEGYERNPLSRIGCTECGAEIIAGHAKTVCSLWNNRVENRGSASR